MHAWPHACIEPGFTAFCAEDDVNDNFAEGLRHAGDDVLNWCWNESRFSAYVLLNLEIPGAVAPGWQ
jgi:hypothetical protein